MKKIIYFLIFSILALTANAQAWKNSRHSVIAGLGINQFMGDLGGGKKDAAHFMGVRDIDFVSTRPVIQIAYKYKIVDALSARINISYASLSGNDAASQNEGRLNRNLNFKTNHWETSFQLEYYFIPEKEIPRWSFSSLSFSRNISAYLFVGIGGFYFNPKGKYNGEWYELRPLATEGQGLNLKYTARNRAGEIVEVTTPEEYGKFAMCIPLGVGIKYRLNKRMFIGLEISARYSSTDYLDDVSHRYINYSNVNGQTVEPPSPMSVIFADRHIGFETNPYPTGSFIRGNPNYNDAYLFTIINFNYVLESSSGQGGSRPKFRSRR